MDASSFATPTRPAIGACGRRSAVTWLAVLALLGLLAAVWGTTAVLGGSDRPDPAQPLQAPAIDMTARGLTGGDGPAARPVAREAERAGYGPDFWQLTSGHTQRRAMWVPVTERGDTASPVVGSADALPLPPVTE